MTKQANENGAHTLAGSVIGWTTKISIEVMNKRNYARCHSHKQTFLNEYPAREMHYNEEQIK